MYPSRALTGFRSFLSVRHRAAGAAVLRVTLGLNMLVLYVLHFPERQFIWGDNGVLPLPLARLMLAGNGEWSLYAYSDSALFHALVFWIGLVIAAAFVVGIAPRLMSILFFVTAWSLYARNPLLMDGGDNILILLAFFMMFIDTSGRFVPWRKDSAQQNPFVALVHNVGVVAILMQVCILYFTSAWAKMSGHMWEDGTAIYYILRSSSFNVSPLNGLIIHNGVLVALLTYATIVLQIGFPFVVWHRILKWPWLAGAFAFHLAIGYSMGLMWFSLVMLSCETLFIDDRSYGKLRAWSRAAAEGLRRWAGTFGKAGSVAPSVPASRIAR